MSSADLERARLLERHESHVKAWNDFDLGALGQIYDPGCHIFDTIPPPAFQSLKDFLEHLTPRLQAFTSFSLRTFDHMVRINEQPVSSVGWILSRYEVEARRGAGVHRRNGRWTEIYERQGDDWKLVHLHSSDDPAEG
ncbi:MAG: hypothetical protein AMS21_05200 [Gemmatimonas sp. SG8_38_2]|nr:MAG: hypothetical protein AMS21_05200 [Gemmatimonas sp. SG8_38_2]